MLLNEQDGDPVRTNGIEITRSPFLLIGDHAGRAIPAALGDMGLSEQDRGRHIAVDLGVRELGLMLGERLQAPFLAQHFSRLVCDCNRDPGDPGWAAEESDGTQVTANAELSSEDRQARLDEIFEPYHQAIEQALEARRVYGAGTRLVSLHSFTPRMDGKDRPWEIGILHDGHEDALALAMLDKLQREEGLTIGDNEPYRMDATDYTVPRHAFPRNLPYVEIEVRQDCLADEAGVSRIADILTRALMD